MAPKGAFFMFVKERWDLILQELKENGQVRVKDLASRFDVTEDLIRKDLKQLEMNGRLSRTYGGAVLKEQNIQKQIASRKKIPNMSAKKEIAKKAFELIEPGMILFLDISTTNVELAKRIAQAQIPVTVITNMLEIMNILAQSSINVIGVGGELDYGREGFIGAVAYESLRHFRFDLSFLGAVGVEPDNNAATILMANEGLTKKLIVERSTRKYLVCEMEKIYKQGNYQFATLDEFDGIILDQNPQEKDLEQLKSHLQVII